MSTCHWGIYDDLCPTQLGIWDGIKRKKKMDQAAAQTPSLGVSGAKYL